MKFSSMRFLRAAAAVLLGANAAAEPLGPSSRRTGLVISEIMYHPAQRQDARNLEWVELYNSEEVPADLSGFRLSGDVAFTFPAGTVLPGLGFLVVAAAPEDVRSVFGATNVFGPFQGNLPNSGGAVRLRSKAGAVFLEVSYTDDAPWPVAADGAGHSMVLSRPSYGEGDPAAWSHSAVIGGSPGAAEPALPAAPHSVVINEFLANATGAQGDFVELYNHSNESVDLSGCVLTDDENEDRFAFPPGTVIGPRGHLAFAQDVSGVGLQAAGEALYFKNAARNRVIDAVRFGGQESGVSSGRFPDGSSEFYRLAQLTPGAANGGLRSGEVVINELMYHPISDDDNDQYVELHNPGGATVNVGGWKLAGGIDFVIPSGVAIPAGGYLVVAKNAARLRSNYPGLTAQNTVGDFAGRLSGSGERIVLTRPQINNASGLFGPPDPVVFDVEVDEVTYGSGGRWGQWADGGGSSLELIDARSNRRLAANWADSDETAKAPWTFVEAQGRIDHAVGEANQLQVLLQGAGECLIDDVEVRGASGGNRLSNPDFESGASGWSSTGTHDQSGLEPAEGHESGQSFRIRAVGRGDTGPNQVRSSLTSPLAQNSMGTIRGWARWLRGHPEVLFRLRGNGLEAIGSLIVPKNLGTPGARNSRALENHSPAIYEVSHAPVLPAARQPVVVSARAEDPDGLESIRLRYRIDPSSAYAAVLMRDDGSGGDAVAGDGLYSATIPGQNSGATSAFYVEAADTRGAASRFPNDAPSRECVVRFGEIQHAGSLGTYRIWMTQAVHSRWSSRHELNNTPLDVTFVYNDQRVIYNHSVMYAGSPYIAPSYNTPTGTLCGYTGDFPKDDCFLGSTDFVLDWPGRDNSAIEEQLAFWIASELGFPSSHRRFIRLHVNGVTDQTRGSIYEDVQQPGSEMLEEWSPDDPDGQLFKVERWFEFDDNNTRLFDPYPRLQNYTTSGGAKKTARYRWNWLPRAVKGSANNFTNLFALVDAVNTADLALYTTRTEAIADMEEMMGLFAVQRIVNGFDSWGHQIGKNMYIYKPQNGRWISFMFDIDWVMRSSGDHGYSPISPLFTPVEDPTVARMYSHPPFRRAYFRAMKRAADGPMRAERIEPLMDAKYRALALNGITRSAGRSLIAPSPVKTWVAQRRAYLLRQLESVTEPFAVTSNGGGDFTSETEVADLSGTAPVDVVTITANGVAYPVTWTSSTTWTLKLPMASGSNPVQIAALNYDGDRIEGGSASFVITYNGPASALPVRINEWMADNSDLIDLSDHETEDWLELFNPNDAAVDLTGYSMIDDPESSVTRWFFPAGTRIEPRGFLFLWADGDTPAHATELHAGFRLSKDGETVGLFGPNGGLVDSITFGPQTENVSEGRWPDGGAEIRVMASPTPSLPNRIAAEAPPRITAVSLAGGSITLQWASVPGARYRVEAAPDLSSGVWETVAEMTENDDTGSFVEAAGAARRFYRVLKLAP